MTPETLARPAGRPPATATAAPGGGLAAALAVLRAGFGPGQVTVLAAHPTDPAPAPATVGVQGGLFDPARPSPAPTMPDAPAPPDPQQRAPLHAPVERAEAADPPRTRSGRIGALPVAEPHDRAELLTGHGRHGGRWQQPAGQPPPIVDGDGGCWRTPPTRRHRHPGVVDGEPGGRP